MPYVHGSIVALITPFGEDPDQTVDYDILCELVEMHGKTGTNGLVPYGTTGEAPTLTREEWGRVVRTVVSEAKKWGVPVIPGTGSYNTREAVELTAEAAEAGASACLVVTPYYNKPTPDGLLRHFKAINEVGIPILLYNIPGRTGINMEPQTILRLCDACPNIIGVKVCNGNLDEITETIYRANDLGREFVTLSGDDSLTLPILSVGGVGIISVVANFLPKAMLGLIRAYNAGETERARKIMHALHPLCRGLLAAGSNPAPAKAVMARGGLKVGKTRSPLADIPAATTDNLCAMVSGAKKQLEALGEELDDFMGSF